MKVVQVDLRECRTSSFLVGIDAIVGLNCDGLFSVDGLDLSFSGDLGCPMAEAMRSFAASASDNKLLMDHMDQMPDVSLMCSSVLLYLYSTYTS